MMVIQSCILTINVRALKKWTGRVRQVTVRFRKIHSFSKFWWYIQGVWYCTLFKVLGEHIFSSIQCVSWKFSVWKGVDGQKALSWENLRFPGFLFIGVRSKISMSIALNQYFFLWPAGFEFLKWLLEFLEKWASVREVEGGGGSQTLNWSVGASRDFCVRHKPKLATCVQTPGPSMACWRSPLIRAYVTRRSNFEGPNLKPQSNPPLTPHHHSSGHL